ncbi:DNA polymerase III subunit gamma and tau [Actinomyces capricornis]|uniref:DNA-directed DNA polymerase n=1 Tax=Actinomyces capricornis TaxID=2755559 RepID=A0ABM7UAS1_9ACTO|nr:DNA polymerase III subunit gamma and tau [Actinomyces capricornis]BDA64421.1 hypothetical protein MANAM107_12550 [Actinomyces capricornis]
MTTALYRRYRPDAFQDVIGQDHVTAPLMAALRADRVTHAYLFSGPRGCGKTTSARILARCLNCAQAPTDTPCGQCPSCQDLATGGPGSLDVVEIDAASHNGVDDARDLRERAAFAPARDRYKIFILDEAHMVTAQGFNALLKLVEEPPAHVKFIFATTEPEKVIGTIRSRTHHYPFRLVPPDTLEAYLAQLCQAEGVDAGPGVFPLVVRAGGGSVRDTLSVMDQLIGGALDGAVDYQRAVALLGYTDTTMLDQCVDAIAAADGAGVFRVVDRVVTSGHDPRRFVEDLLQRLRDLLVIALAGDQAGPALGSLPVDELSRMDVQARTLGAAALSRAADMTAQALTAMVGATSPRLQLELLVARLIVPVAGAQGAGAAAMGAPVATAAAGPAAQGGATGGPGAASGPAAPSRSGTAPASGRELAAQAARQASTGSTPESPPTAGGEGSPGGGAAPGQGGAPAGGPAHPGAAQAAEGYDPRRQGAAAGTEGASGSGPDSSAGPAGMPPVAWDEGEPPSHPGDRRASGARGGAGSSGQAPAVPWEEAAPGSAPSAGAPSGAPQGTQEPPGPGAAEAEMLRTRWEEVLEAAKRSRRATWALVGPNSRPGTLANGVLTLLFNAPGLVGAFENGGHGPILAAAIHQALGLQVEVRAILTGDDGPGGSGGPGGPGGHGPGGGRGGRPGSGPQGGAGSPGPPSGGRGGVGARAPQGFEAPGEPSGASGPGGWEAEPPPEDWEAVPPTGAVGDGPTDAAGTASGDGAAPHRSAPATTGAPPSDDGWGPVAIPGGGASPSPQEPEDAGPGPEPGVESVPGTGSAASPEAAPDFGPAAGPARGPDGGPGPRGADATAAGAARGVGDDGWGPVVVPGGEALGQDRAQPPEGPPGAGAQGPQDDGDLEEDEPRLATVHRLRALPPTPAGPARGPDSPGSAPSTAGAPETGPAQAVGPAEAGGPGSPSGALSPTSWEEPETFSDGIPLPEEPGDPDGPAPQDSATWAPSGMAGSRLAAAMAAARAAAQSEDVSLAEDTPSEDDEDAEDAGVVGLEVVKRILGATVIEEITVTQEGH